MKDREYTQKWIIVVHTMMPAAGKLRQTAHRGGQSGSPSEFQDSQGRKWGRGRERSIDISSVTFSYKLLSTLDPCFLTC